jgi:hypothetical protein
LATARDVTVSTFTHGSLADLINQQTNDEDDDESMYGTGALRNSFRFIWWFFSVESHLDWHKKWSD